jgi:hypothetical protein
MFILPLSLQEQHFNNYIHRLEEKKTHLEDLFTPKNQMKKNTKNTKFELV